MINEGSIPVECFSERSSEMPRLHPAFFDNHAREWMSGALITTDLVCLFVAIPFALYLSSFPHINVFPPYDQVFTLLAIIMLIKFYRAGLYPGIGLHYIDELNKLVTSISSAFVIVLAVTFLLRTPFIYSRTVIFSSWVISILLIPTGRYLVRRFLIYVGFWGMPVVIIGNPEKARALADDLRIHLQHGIRPELIICDGYCLADYSSGQYPVFSTEKVKEYAQLHHLENALVLVDDLNNVDLLVDRHRFTFNRVILIKDQNGKYGLNNLQTLDFTTVLGLQVNNHLLDWWSQILKRFFDILGSVLGLLLLSPLLTFIAVAIKFDSPGNVFYRQVRLGKGGKSFNLLKFRTMYINNDIILKAKLASDQISTEEWNRYQKLKKDPRITRIGKLLRKFSLDELPQLLNIVVGDMSLVGPRPIMPAQREFYGANYKDYIQVLPGLTGLWQVSGRNQTTFIRRVELDNEYIQRWSMWMDIFILIKTLKVVLRGDGAY
jgi:Undecaprenyl-phosphate galactose phosphotransferase WbaP